jgi:3-phenylpropionate/trans-cinnamate dioxygenase ferredoxin subunit
MTTLNFDALVEGKPVQVDVEGVKVCVARVGDEVFAISDICSHAEANLSEGEYKGYVIECWLHGAEFDLRTGEALTLPAIAPVKTYKVSREENVVSISAPNQESEKQ